MTPLHTPRELPDLRVRMAEFWDNPANHEWAAVVAENRKQDFRSDPEEWAHVVQGVLRNAELFHVDHTIASIASESSLANDYGFMPYDLPCPTGFAYYPTGSHQGDGTGPFVITWDSVEPHDDAPHGSLHLYVYVPKDEMIAQFARSNPSLDWARFDRAHPPFVFFSWLAMRFAEDGDDIEFRSYVDADRVDWHGQNINTLLATCHLMRQKLTETATESPDRSSRRRHQRAGLEPPEIRTIALRRSERPATPAGESTREFHHRWVVRGHWRKHWYPSIEAHRPIWIAPFIKGPEDAPLLGGDKVYTVRDNTPK